MANPWAQTGHSVIHQLHHESQQSSRIGQEHLAFESATMHFHRHVILRVHYGGGGSPENFAIAFLWVLRVHLYHLLAIRSRNAVTSTFIYQAIGAGIPMFSCLLFLEMFWVSKFKCKDRVVTAASFKCVCKCAWRSVALCDGELDHHFSTDEGMDHTILVDLKNGACNLVQSGLSVLE